MQAYQDKKEPCMGAQRRHGGARKWTVSPLNHSSGLMDAGARSSGNALEDSSVAFCFTSNSSSLLSSTNSTSSGSSQGCPDILDSDMRNLILTTATSSASPQILPTSISRSWEEAIASQNIESVQHLLKCGFSASGEGAQTKKPPLILAVLTGNSALVRLLLTAGADINCTDSEGLTALHHAAASGDRNLVKLLLVAGADLYARTKQGMFPMHLAAGPTHQILSQRLKSDMENPTTHSWVYQSLSGNIDQQDQQSFSGPKYETKNFSQRQPNAISEISSISDPLVEGPKKGPVFFRCSSFGQTELEGGIASELLEGLKMGFPSSSSPAISNQDKYEHTFVQGSTPNHQFKDGLEKGKKLLHSQNVWLQNLYVDKVNRQGATLAPLCRNSESRHPGALDEKYFMEKIIEFSPQMSVGNSSQKFTSAMVREKMGKLADVQQIESMRQSIYVQDQRLCFGPMMDGIFKEQEDSLGASRAWQLKQDQKEIANNMAFSSIEENVGNLGVVQVRNESKQDGSPSSSLHLLSGQLNDTKREGMQMLQLSSDMPHSSHATPPEEGAFKGQPELSGGTEASQDFGDKSLCSNVLLEDGGKCTSINKLQQEMMDKPLPSQGSDSCSQERGRKQVKFVSPSDEDLAHVRKDWHDAAHAGCVGCGAEGCGGECLPKNAYGKKNQQSSSNVPSASRPKKNFKKAQMKKTKNFEWKRGELLGEGAYGKVFSGLNQSTGELMAVKQLKFHNSNDDEEKAFYMTCLEREISLYKEMRHKHIVGYIDMDKDESSGYLYIFLEYISGGSIQSMLERFGPFSEPLVRVYTRQLLLGLEYLHKNRIVHRDIKGGNVLVDSDGIVKLADFGASKAFHEATITDACKSIRGSIFWMAPEVIKGDNYGRHADIWSVGCTVIEMLTAMHPWPGIDNSWAAIFQIAKASSGPPIPETASDCARDFLSACFHLDPKMRPSASQLLEHPFVAKASELVDHEGSHS